MRGLSVALPLSIGLFVLAGLCEIGGGYLVWIWLRQGKPIGYALWGRCCPNTVCHHSYVSVGSFR